LRKFLDQFSDEEYNELVEMLQKSTANRVFEKYTRDDAVLLVYHLLLQNPKFLWFGIKHGKKIVKAL